MILKRLERLMLGSFTSNNIERPLFAMMIANRQAVDRCSEILAKEILSSAPAANACRKMA